LIGKTPGAALNGAVGQIYTNTFRCVYLVRLLPGGMTAFIHAGQSGTAK